MPSEHGQATNPATMTAAERKRRQRNLLPHLKIFLQKRLPQKGYPLSGAETVFGQVFGRGGMSNFQNPKVPPPGGRICRTHIQAR
jgi:hypothetical protein